MGIFGNDRVVFKNPSTPRIKISRLYLRKSWQVYNTTCAPVTVTAEIFAYIRPICAFSSLSITFAWMCPVVKFIFCIVQLELYQLLYLLTNNILGKIDYAFDLINYVTLLLSWKTIANSPKYCIYTLVMNTYCINKRGIFLPLSLFFLPSFTGHSLQCSHSFPFSLAVSEI